LPNINIIAASNDGLSSQQENLSYLSDCHIFENKSPKYQTNNSNYNFFANYNVNNSFDSDASGNSFHSYKTPRPFVGNDQYFFQQPYDNIQNNQDNINFIINNLNPNINNQQCNTNNNSNANNANCHYSSFSPMRTQIKIKSRYSSHNIASGYNMNNNHPFLVHTNSNVHQQNKNLLLHHPSTFSTLARANSNKLCHSSNSLLNNMDNNSFNQGMVNSPMVSPNTSGNNLMILNSPQHSTNSNNNNNGGNWILNRQSSKNTREYYTPQTQRKVNNRNILQFRGTGVNNNAHNMNNNNDDNRNKNKKQKQSNENKNENNRDKHNTSSNSASANINPKKKNLDIPRNKIHLESILRQKDKRTTIMIRHIPNKYTLKLFSDEINKIFLNKYDLLYLPVDIDNHCNLGFGFINFVDPIHIIAFYDKYFGKKWEKFNSDKICELAYAKVQGKEDLIKHIEQNGNISNTDMPVYLTHDITEEDKKKVLIELPIKFLQAFLNFYPYSLYRVISYDKFIVDSFYNF
jgi:hypothetical protein